MFVLGGLSMLKMMDPLLALSTTALVVSGALWAFVDVPRVHDISVASFAFDPNYLTITEGDIVRWTVAAGRHSATSDTGAWDSAEMEASQSFQHRFNSQGVFPYFCRPHTFMQAQIAVRAAPFGRVVVHWGALGFAAASLVVFITVLRRRIWMSQQ